MQKAQDHQYDLLLSSSGLGWSNLFAEVRSYGRGEGVHPAEPETKITITLDRSEGTSGWRIGGSWRSSEHIPGLFWVKPKGGKYDEAYIITAKKIRFLNLHLTASVFTQLGDYYGLPAALDRSSRHVCGVQDEVINQIGLSVLSEMMTPTAAGRMFTETASLLLAARLLHAHWDAGSVRLPIERRHGLDERRMRRVLDYVEEHLADDVAVADLANVACLSIFYFTRAFSAAVGMPPHRYVSQRRLERAKTMIAAGATSIAEMAFMCGFSSQSSFTRAFRRATGLTPAMYRREFGP
ncbi:helix-turn-helix domain-containing protein [Bradyrhizobium sp.]|uniref:helix-turn-helix domain-containing protein n=1 Tax=Bradyrhizobium sp. TaxID=376 RepID=UPI003C7492D0